MKIKYQSVWWQRLRHFWRLGFPLFYTISNDLLSRFNVANWWDNPKGSCNLQRVNNLLVTGMNQWKLSNVSTIGYNNHKIFLLIFIICMSKQLKCWSLHRIEKHTQFFFVTYFINNLKWKCKKTNIQIVSSSLFCFN